MNTRGGWALIKRTWAMWIQQRSFFFLLAFGWMIPPLVYLFVWSTAAGETTAGGLSRGEFGAYYLVLVLVNQLTYSQTNWTVGDVIRYGGMNMLLLRPLSPVFDALSTEVAGKVVYMIFVIPVTVVLAVVHSGRAHSQRAEVVTEEAHVASDVEQRGAGEAPELHPHVVPENVCPSGAVPLRESSSETGDVISPRQ